MGLIMLRESRIAFCSQTKALIATKKHLYKDEEPSGYAYRRILPEPVSKIFASGIVGEYRCEMIVLDLLNERRKRLKADGSVLK